MGSTICANHTKMFIIGEERTRKLAMLRKYLRQSNVSRNLAQRMQRNANHALEGDIVEDTVELLPVVADSLRLEMHFEVFSRDIQYHSCLGDYIHASKPVMRSICHHAMMTVYVSEGES